MIHCDAGPSVVRSYPVKQNGLGFAAEIVNVMDGAKHNQWFRPSDVCVARMAVCWFPIGTILVSAVTEWATSITVAFSAVTAKSDAAENTARKNPKRPITLDLSRPSNAARALCSPNQATRFLAFRALQRFGEQSRESLERFLKTRTHVSVRGLFGC